MSVRQPHPVSSSATGDVVGPASSTDNAIVRFDGTTGKAIQDSGITIADTTNLLTTPGDILLTEASSGNTSSVTVDSEGFAELNLDRGGTSFGRSATVNFKTAGTTQFNMGLLGVADELIVSDESNNILLRIADGGSVGNVTVTGTLSVTGAASASNLSGTNTGDVTLAGTPDYITLTNQVLTRAKLDPADDLNTFASSVLSGLLTDATGTGLAVFNNSPTFVDDVTIGTAGTATGSILMKGTTSGTVTIKTADAAGTWTLTLPANDGDVDQVLSTNGSGVTSWVTAGGGSGDITAVGDVASGAAFDGTAGTTLTGTSAGGILITVATAGASSNGGTAYVVAADGGATSGNGGEARLQSGSATTSGAGGTVQISSGSAAGSNSNGGNITLSCGSADAGDADGGRITLSPGAKAGSGNHGRVVINGRDSSVATEINFDVAQASITTADIFIDFTSTGGASEGSVAGTAVAGVIAYNTFTGAHKTITDGSPEPMMLVEMTGETISAIEFEAKRKTKEVSVEVDDMDAIVVDGGIRPKKTIIKTVIQGPSNKEFLPKTRLCATRGSRACFGVYGGRDKDGLDNSLAIGTGWILVANKGKNIEAGDYLISSDIPGLAELQDDDIKRSSTVASASQNIVWLPGETSRRVACRYLMG